MEILLVIFGFELLLCGLGAYFISRAAARRIFMNDGKTFQTAATIVTFILSFALIGFAMVVADGFLFHR